LVTDIDRQLYAKYGLSEEEIGFIEGMIKVMVWGYIALTGCGKPFGFLNPKAVPLG